MGSFVPAEFASIKIFKRIFLSSPSKDDILNGTSTFMEEMNSMSNLFSTLPVDTNTDLSDNSGLAVTDLSATCDSFFDQTLILIDELGRGTSIRDSLAINIAICEAFLERLEKHNGAFIFMTTWLSPLIEYLSSFPNVVFYHLATDVRNII